ncbi:hypothetical protein EIN_149470 [Entamoeba invadens IP1]|uniref:Uncharacterized protein n=1 Tax=Entamoeba invadens IP1 TaxID=370355 RepID=L7FK06_ENTIV|nr:hypothetical protein EIN_149470 [Entamoeba invadens IP1]ELP85545.1 hypothetical protein EIN_149470 [Entamoeba invadens IP1]|eukprot:XP_004184891.1 hypothetical protein EIN_149470 [Entamoeba invadens IP1]
MSRLEKVFLMNVSLYINTVESIRNFMMVNKQCLEAIKMLHINSYIDVSSYVFSCKISSSQQFYSHIADFIFRVFENIETLQCCAYMLENCSFEKYNDRVQSIVIVKTAQNKFSFKQHRHMPSCVLPKIKSVFIDPFNFFRLRVDQLTNLKIVSLCAWKLPKYVLRDVYESNSVTTASFWRCAIPEFLLKICRQIELRKSKFMKEIETTTVIESTVLTKVYTTDLSQAVVELRKNNVKVLNFSNPQMLSKEEQIVLGDDRYSGEVFVTTSKALLEDRVYVKKYYNNEKYNIDKFDDQITQQIVGEKCELNTNQKQGKKPYLGFTLTLHSPLVLVENGVREIVILSRRSVCVNLSELQHLTIRLIYCSSFTISNSNDILCDFKCVTIAHLNKLVNGIVEIGDYCESLVIHSECKNCSVTSANHTNKNLMSKITKVEMNFCENVNIAKLDIGEVFCSHVKTSKIENCVIGHVTFRNCTECEFLRTNCPKRECNKITFTSQKIEKRCRRLYSLKSSTTHDEFTNNVNCRFVCFLNGKTSISENELSQFQNAEIQQQKNLFVMAKRVVFVGKKVKKLHFDRLPPNDQFKKFNITFDRFFVGETIEINSAKSVKYKNGDVKDYYYGPSILSNVKVKHCKNANLYFKNNDLVVDKVNGVVTRKFLVSNNYFYAKDSEKKTLFDCDCAIFDVRTNSDVFDLSMYEGKKVVITNIKKHVISCKKLVLSDKVEELELQEIQFEEVEGTGLKKARNLNGKIVKTILCEKCEKVFRKKCEEIVCSDNVEKVVIGNCKKLVKITLSENTKILHIQNCPKLTHIEGIKQVATLTIKNCEKYIH